MPGIINSRAWLSSRRAFLQAELSNDHTDEQRAAISAELATIEQELAESRRRWRRWLLIGGKPS